MKVLVFIAIATVQITNCQKFIYTKTEYDAFFNWQTTYNTEVNSTSKQTRSEMRKIINDFRVISAHNLKFEAGTATFSQNLWQKSHLTAAKRDKLRTGFRIVDLDAALNALGNNSAQGNNQNTQNNQNLQNNLNNVISNMLINKVTTFPIAPAALDWRDFGVIGPVQDQGYECSSCWAFTAIGAIEAAYAIATGKIVKLSEQQLLDCNFNFVTGNWGCSVSDFRFNFFRSL